MAYICLLALLLGLILPICWPIEVHWSYFPASVMTGLLLVGCIQFLVFSKVGQVRKAFWVTIALPALLWTLAVSWSGWYLDRAVTRIEACQSLKAVRGHFTGFAQYAPNSLSWGMEFTGVAAAFLDVETADTNKGILQDMRREMHLVLDLRGAGRDMPLLSGTQALWELEVRIHSLGFKELIGLLRTGQCATGTIVRAFRLTQIDSPPPSYATRHRLRNYLDGRWPSEQSGAPLSIGAQSQAAAIFKAVTLGDATAVDKHSWDLFQRTGTIHLLVISGLHLGFVAYLGAQILTWLLRRFGPIAFLWMPVAHWKWLGALISASAYAVIGGFSISVKRALAMLCIASIPFLLRRRMNYALLMLYALAGLLIMNPLHALIPGLWLSFGGVGALVLYTLTYRQNRVLTLTTSLSNEPDQPIRFMDRVLDPVLLFWGAQCAVLIVMLPLTALMSLPVSWLALPANLWAVPLMGWLAVPLSLVSFVLLPLSSFFIWIPLWVIQATLVGMEWVSTLWVPPLILNNPLTGVAWVWAALLFFSPHGFVCKKMWPVPLALCLIMPA